MFWVGAHTMTQGLSVLKGRERAINPAKHFAQRDFLRRALELITAVGAAEADHNSRALEIEKNRLQKFLRQFFLGGNVLDLDHADRVLREHRECLQGVQSSLRDSHGGWPIPY